MEFFRFYLNKQKSNQFDVKDLSFPSGLNLYTDIKKEKKHTSL